MDYTQHLQKNETFQKAGFLHWLSFSRRFFIAYNRTKASN